MNEIQADVGGVVAEIYPHDAQLVQNGDRLFAIRGLGPSVANLQPAVEAETVQENAAVPQPDNIRTIHSPIVGIFYRIPNPEAPPFVEVGSRVREDQVLCVVEAMKMMNEIESDYAGIVVGIYPKNGQAIEFGEPLFDIKTD